MIQNTTLLLVRHGETSWNALGKAQGIENIPLNEKGLIQSQEIAKQLKLNHQKIAAIYSSDLIRAYQTAEAISQIFSLPIFQHSDLREISFGEAEGLKFPEIILKYAHKKKELDEKYPDKKDRWKVTEIPGAETLESAFHRFTSVLQTIGQAHPGKVCIIVTHGKLLKTLMEEMQNLSTFPPIPNCGLIQISYCLVSHRLNVYEWPKI